MALVVMHGSRGGSPAAYDRTRGHDTTPSYGRGSTAEASAVAGETAPRAIGRAATR